MNAEEYVNISDFVYKGEELYNIGDGDSFCYAPCDIYGTPKLYYADSHFECSLQALDDIIHSFYKGEIENLMSEEDIYDTAQEIWSSYIREPGRVFLGKYIVTGFDGHVPSTEYVQGVLDYLGGKPEHYSVTFNRNDTVKEIPANVFLQKKHKEKKIPTKLTVPNKLKEIYDEITNARHSVDKKFPKNMVRAKYYYLTRQENKKYNKIIIETINQYLNRK